MAGSKLKRVLSGIVVVGATAGIIYGVAQLTRYPAPEVPETTQQEEVAGELPTVDMTEVWTPPAGTPAENDFDGRIACGDFSVVSGADAADIRALEAAFERVRVRSRYMTADVTHDGREELLWLTERENSTAEQVIAVFTREEDALSLLLFSPDETTDEYYLAGEDTLYYIRQNDWVISEYHCTQVLFDRYLDMYGGTSLSMYLVEHTEEYETQVDAAVRRRMSFVDGRGVWYRTLEPGQEEDEARRVHADEWLRLFSERTGQSFAAVAPLFEAKRSGIETGVGAYTETVRRSSYAEVPFTEIIRYPQVTDGDRMETVNRLLREEALAMSVGAGNVASAEAYLTQLKKETPDAREGEVYYRVAHNADDMISIQYGLSRKDAAQGDARAISLITIEKSSGRQIQIGDVTTIERIYTAADAGYAELFYLRAGGTGLTLDTDKAHDSAYLCEALERTRTSSDSWKNIGLDEQYVYLGVVTKEGGQPDAILRVPRWRVGMSSPGHMELLTMHRAYPYLKETLDGAQSLTVRKKTDGFEITFLTPDGGRVVAHLHATEITIPEAYTVPAVRDLLIFEYPDVTGVVIGELTLADEEERTADYYIVDSSLGAIGRVLLKTPEGDYEITQNRYNTNEGILGALTGTDGTTTWTIHGELHEDASGYAVWHNLQNGSYRLTRSISDTARFVFELSPAEGAEETEEREEEAEDVEEEEPVSVPMTVTIYPEDREGLAEVYEIAPEKVTITFRDVDADGYDDLTIGTIHETDHTDEYNFLYRADENRYVQGPEELRSDVDYSYGPGTGYARIVKDGTRSLYAPRADGTLQLLRSLDLETEGSVTTAVVRVYEDDGTREDDDAGTERDIPSEVILYAPYDAACIRFTDALFSSELVYEGLLSDFSGEDNERDEDAEDDEAPRLYVLRHRVSDIISPYDLVYVAVVHPFDGVLGMEVYPETGDTQTKDSFLEEVQEGEDGTMRVLWLTLVHTDEESGEETETQIAVDPYALSGGR